MLQIFENRQALLNEGVRTPALYVNDETDAAGVVLTNGVGLSRPALLNQITSMSFTACASLTGSPPKS